MIWQDIVIMIACFGFAIALVPSIIGKRKPEKLSCAITIILLIAIAISFATLGLWLSFGSEITAIVAWGILLFQKRD
jgi:amino acid permease